MVVFVVVIDRIAQRQLPDHLGDIMGFLLDEQVDTVGHQAIGAYAAMTGRGAIGAFLGGCYIAKEADEPLIVFFLLKDRLMVGPSEHHVVDACLASVSGMSGHVVFCSLVFVVSAKLVRFFKLPTFFLNLFLGNVPVVYASVFRHLYFEIAFKKKCKMCPLR